MFRRILYTLILQLIFKCIRTLIIKQYLVVVYMLLSYLIMREGHKVICKTATVKKMEKNAECAVKLLLVSRTCLAKMKTGSIALMLISTCRYIAAGT